VAYAPDNSSINIYMHGGTNGAESFDDVAILSLPSFTWIAAYDGATTRWGATCHRAGPRQMISIGGGGSSADITTGCDPSPNGLSVFDLSDLTWGSVYDAGAASYQVPAALVSIIGGERSGNATMTEPPNGWTEMELSSLFRVDSSSSPAKALSGGKIAGIVIGAVAGLAISGGCIIFFFLRYWRSRRTKDLVQSWEPERSASERPMSQPFEADTPQPTYTRSGTVLHGLQEFSATSEPVEME